MSSAAPCPLDLCSLPGTVIGGVTGRAGGVVSNAVGGVVGNWVQDLADAVLDALGKALASLGTLWVNVGTPNLTTSGGHPSDAVSFLQGSLWWYMGAAAVLSVIVGGARMAIERKADPGRDVLRGLLTLAVVVGAGLTVIALSVAAADGFAGWIIDGSLEGTDFGQNVATMIGLSSRAGPLGPLLVIIFGLLAILASAVQIMLMVVRGGMLVILAGVLPLAAAFTSSETGRAWFRKCVGWLIAFILYKPVAAIVYATAFRLTGSDIYASDESGLLNVLVGLVLMILALVALPALMRFVTPMVAATAGGGGRSALGSAALAALPSGAIALGSRGGGPSGGFPRQGRSPASSSAPTGAGAGGPGPGGAAAASAAGGAAAKGAAAGGPAGAVAGQALRAGQRGADGARRAVENADEDEEGPDGSR
ncbi:MAG: hypothetical protein QOK49_3251 [Baekduia sp.]|nr:hypothetical protein [Baekduia sp.]